MAIGSCQKNGSAHTRDQSRGIGSGQSSSSCSQSPDSYKNGLEEPGAIPAYSAVRDALEAMLATRSPKRPRMGISSRTTIYVAEEAHKPYLARVVPS